jgi:transposase-like protein
MVIVLDCPRCSKRYEVEAALAGKKSRCKQCGEIFRIPVPRADLSTPPSSAHTSEAAESERHSVLAEPKKASRPVTELPPAPPRSAVPGLAVSKIALNCPQCQKRYEVDGALAGKKSRCKSCGSVFSIPLMSAHASDLSTMGTSPAPSPPVPSPTSAYWESMLKEEPSTFKPKGRPELSDDGDGNLLPPPRATYVQWADRSYSQRARAGDSDFGLTISGFYVLMAIVLAVGLWIWTTAAVPSKERAGSIFALTTICVHGTAVVLSLVGSIWIFVIAFREKMRTGMLCVFVPCYQLFYVITRWEQTRGPFAMQMLPVGSAVILAATAFGIGLGRGSEGTGAAAMASAERGSTGVPEFENGPAARPDVRRPGPGGAPPGLGMPRGRGFRGINPGRQRGSVDIKAQVQKFGVEQGERTVMILYSGIPANSDPARGVTAREVSEAVRQRFRQLVPGATRTTAVRRNNKYALVLSPVDDVAGLASQIDFGTATATGQQIDLVLSADFIASVPRLPAEQQTSPLDSGPAGNTAQEELPQDADAVTKSLVQLKSSDINKKKEALRRLERTPPDERLAEVVAAVVPFLEHDDEWLVGDAVKILAIWKSPDAVPGLIRRSGDNRVLIRHEAIKALAKIKDPRAVEPIVVRIKEDGFQVEDALKQMGPMAESALIERLTNPDSDVRRRVCSILKVIGGKETLKAMKSLPADPNFSVRVAANDAMSTIVLRVGPLSPSERKTKPR